MRYGSKVCGWRWARRHDSDPPPLRAPRDRVEEKAHSVNRPQFSVVKLYRSPSQKFDKALKVNGQICGILFASKEEKPSAKDRKGRRRFSHEEKLDPYRGYRNRLPGGWFDGSGTKPRFGNSQRRV